ncbi:hypothetical protein RRG08_066842 [Elysia crispata]|uniref:Uncharacterized protein n=1 Tax=Elysia crispata TaxID=231223 RepID=A0AAE0XQX2_9GAST|nr:hypothetical protein RRG08_066842 [Elysia crispata]
MESWCLVDMLAPNSCLVKLHTEQLSVSGKANQQISTNAWHLDFILQTDHKPQLFLKNGKAKISRLMRWALAFREFSFSISFLPCVENALSERLLHGCIH